MMTTLRYTQLTQTLYAVAENTYFELYLILTISIYNFCIEQWRQDGR